MNAPLKRETVVILHGIGMSPLRMLWLSWRLKRAGFNTMNLHYPSLRYTIEDCARIVEGKIYKKLQGSDTKIHVVTHSMGGLVALELLQKNTLKNLGRVVMIAPPFGGSEVADKLAQKKLYRRFFGPAGQQLTTMYRSSLSTPDFGNTEIGVIAGNRAYEYPFFKHIMKGTGEHDGLVSVQSTRMNGLKEHITIRMSHSFLIEISASKTVHFLTHGQFTPARVTTIQ